MFVRLTQVRQTAYELLCDTARPESLLESFPDVKNWRMLIDIGLGALSPDVQPGDSPVLSDRTFLTSPLKSVLME